MHAFRLALRALRKDRWFSLAAIVTLGLGIGVTSAVFTLVNAALIRDLPLDRPDRLMFLATQDATGRPSGVSYLDYRSWHEQSRTFGDMAASVDTAMILGDEEKAPERVQGTYITANLFRLIGAARFLGRDFRASDEEPGAPAVVIFAYGVWKNRYGADPSLVGQTIRVNDRPAVVIGVMPEGFQFPFANDGWAPLPQLPGLLNQRRDARTLNVYGRLRDGVTPAQAREDLDAVAVRLAHDYAETNASIRPTIVTISQAFRGEFGSLLLALMGAVSFVLLIACVNVGNLLLVRSARRSLEFALRISLGATHWHIVRQLAIECLSLSLFAGIIGFGLAVYCVRLFVALFDTGPGGPPSAYWLHWTMDARAVMFAAAISLGTCLLFGLAPTLRLLKTNLNDLMKEGGRSAGGALRGRWTTALMAAEIAATVILLAGAGLMIRSFFVIYGASRVIDPANLVAMRLTMPIQKYRTADQRKDLVEQLEQRVGTLPGISSVAVAYQTPFAYGELRRVSIDGRNPTAADTSPTVTYMYVGVRYFETLGVRAIRGRAFMSTDGRAGFESAIVNQRFAAMFFPGEDPLGRRIQLTGAIRSAFSAAPSTTGPVAPWLTIVGIVPAVPQRMDDEQDPVVYVPYRGEPEPVRSASLLVRGQPGLNVAASVREEVRHLEPDMALYMTFSMEQLFGFVSGAQRVFGNIFLLLAGIALVLSSVGLYAVTAYGVTERTREIGVRMALGAQRAQLVWLFAKQTAAYAAIGTALGVGGALAAGRVIQSLLIRTSPRDPIVLTAVAAFIALVAMIAAVVPARRAAQVDPMVALRHT
jgi:putative ABC transport system permease protein